MALQKIALVTCSTREPRLNPFITQYVKKILSNEKWEGKLEIIDLEAHSLPLYNEPAIPSHLPSTNPTPHYVHEHTRAWSKTVRQYDGFIFVTPQYNWSIPASLKNALDYLYWEWNGKPAGIVTYGGKGGGKAGDHLQQILTGLRMKTVSIIPGFPVGSHTMDSCLKENGINKDDHEVWQSRGVEEKVRLMFQGLIENSSFQ
ncbi:uncharacterized protein MYU51_004301 [Penicillium brevicompactum]|uniref:uncharacterized protein n=1 Tax=Penicillium brevicompactum TaxID=5074 RepID=UPI00254137AE|nr:uncharacterized protein N7506_000535 [Penicillium brevicompactum]KAJ5347282.1 hypothetical protein N7506_000535 [Penicillium brevicompactum]